MEELDRTVQHRDTSERCDTTVEQWVTIVEHCDTTVELFDTRVEHCVKTV